MPAATILPLALFAAAILSFGLYVLAVSGHFPRHARAPAGSTVGSAVVWGGNAVSALALLIALAAAWLLIPWYAAVIAGGLAILSAPLVLQVFPDAFIDGHGALVGFAGASIALAVALLWLTQAA